MKKNYIYIIVEKKINPSIKIGVSNNVYKRLSNVQTSNSNEVFLYHFEEREDAYKVESLLKKRLIKYHKNGEWYFNLTPEKVRIELIKIINY